MTEEQIYEEVVEAQNIIGTLVDNIYHDDAYQDYLTELESNDDKSSIKKVANIKSTFSNIKIFNTNTEPLFLAQDIGIIIGATNIKAMIKNFNSREKVTGNIRISGKVVNKEFLTKRGIYRILLTNRTKLSDVFRDFIYELIDNIINNEVSKLNSIKKKYREKNPELIKEASTELYDNIRKYKQLYEEEFNERSLLETEVSIKNMYIEQLKLDKENAQKKIKNLKYESSISEENIIINNLKKKYMKEFDVYLVPPETLKNVFTGINPINKIKNSFILDDYISNYDMLTRSLALDSKINEEEILYVNFSYKTKKSDKVSTSDNEIAQNNQICIMTDYIHDKNKYSELIDILKKEFDHYRTVKGKNSTSNIIFELSIDDIKRALRDLML